ncbi:hypothetical protein [Fictibacillus barbaricus]|uniref:DUF4367 domain-containing protein n=1 Tax=Fictibacillus barbaricus TaxID=182136 RepID=A0ABU1U356_9BACL|nr:hypothetical protein [Fictibacillus barbaricus]MDR7073930.1 hypothetical protein [Fictibacillus barbaricus]
MNRKSLILFFIAIVFLVSCQSNSSNGTLNDKKLKLQDHAKGAYPRYYERVSKETASKALPFPMNLPKKLPFKVVLTTYQISDWGEKRNILLDTVFYPKQEGKNVYLAYRVSNFLPKGEEKTTKAKVKLENGTEAYFSGNADLPILLWEEDGLFHKMEYLIREGSDSKKEKEKLLKAASSVYDNK